MPAATAPQPPAAPPPATAPPAAPRELLAEVQGLRAVAVGVVILFHLWPARLTGGYVGVDVFFVISGFLITAHLLREIDTRGRIDLPRFWARRVRRLLPAAVLVLVITLVATLVFLPEPSWQRTVVEIAAASAYVLNWVLAASAVDYFAAENAATAVQHYWSLSVEEQFYLLWPLLLTAAVLLARRRGAPARRYLAVCAAAVVAVSFAYSVVHTLAVPVAAYFSTWTHAWEFAAGALLALVGPAAGGRWSSLLRVRALASTAGFVTILACAVVFTGETAFPGWVAAVPVIGTLLVIAAGDTRGTRLSTAPLVRLRGVQLLGDVSYSAYLWHWPLIVVTPFVLDRPLDAPVKLVLLALTLVLAWLTKQLVEDPVRLSRGWVAQPRNAFAAAGAAAMVVVVACSTVWLGVQARTERAVLTAQDLALQASAGEEPCFGAAAVLSGEDCDNRNVLDPDLLLAASAPAPEEPRTVVVGGVLEGSAHGDPEADTTIALVGDSHAGHYAPALRAIADRNGWEVVFLTFNNCSPSAPTWESSVRADMFPKCQQRRSELMTAIADDEEIDVVVTSSVAPRYTRRETPEVQGQIADAFVDMWTSWTEGGKSVVVIADVPGPGDVVDEAKDCVAASGTVQDPCTAPRDEVLEQDPMVVAAGRVDDDRVSLADFTPAYCDEDLCHSVVGGIVVYNGGAHISTPFAMSLAPFLEEHVEESVAQAAG